MKLRSLAGLVLASALAPVASPVGCSSDSGSGDGAPVGAGGGTGGSNVIDGGEVVPTASCKAAGGSAPVQKPTFVRNLPTGETGWFGSPALVDVDGDGKKDVVATDYSVFVYDGAGKKLGTGKATAGRVYAPGVAADIDADGKVDLVVAGSDGSVAAYDWEGGALTVKAGWPAVACLDPSGCGDEVRGMAAGDLDGDGKLEIAVTTTADGSGAEVHVFSADGKPYQPPGLSFTSWPRYNKATGPGNDADWNGQGNQGYGCYGENVGIGNLDDDPELEIVVTYDNHQINAFNHDGTSILAADWYTNRDSNYSGQRMGWGQFIRWLDPKVEDDHYHLHTGAWPSVDDTMWLQWTASPPNVVDVDGDGKNDVVGLPNAELHQPYETQGYAFMVLEGAYGDGSRSARRLAAFETLPQSDKPAVRPDGDWYPPSGIPAPTTVNILGDPRPELIAAVNDGFVYVVGPDGQRLWRFEFTKGAPKTFASEVVVADLNRDGAPELVFGTYSLEPNAGRLIVLANTGALLFDVELPDQGSDGNGIGIPAAPTIGDLDGDGQLEIVVSTFDHGVDVFTVPGSGEGCLPWPTARGSYLRSGAGPSTVTK